MTIKTNNYNRKAFTIVEALAALAIVGFVCGSVIIVINNSIDAISDQTSRLRAIEVARENMESLGSQEVLQESSITGISEIYPEIEWTTTVEAVNFPGESKLWLRAFCSANFYNTDNELEEVSFENWLTPLSAQQQKLVMEDRKKEEDYLEQLEQMQQEEESQEQDEISQDDKPNQDEQQESRDDDSPVPDMPDTTGSGGLNVDDFIKMLEPKR